MADPVSSELTKKALEPVGGLLKRIAGPLADEVGESLALVARPYRIALSVKMLQKTQRMLREAGLEAQAVPPRLFLPMLEAGSIENDDHLHTKWAALLVNAATSSKVHPSYIEILKQLTPEDARLLDKLYNETTDKKHRWLNHLLDLGAYTASSENLVRLGLIQITYNIDGLKVAMRYDQDSYVSGEMEEDRWLTDFAVGFIEACQAPKTMEAAPKARQ
jgi:hypothetical protein